MRATTAVEEFVEQVLASGLLTEEQVSQADLPSDAPAAEAARVLVRVRLLTPFQARTLLSGEPRSFFVTERYKILEHLGRGGMGEVFMVEHLLLRRVVAMKLIVPATDTGSGGAGAVERFFREARAVAALDHPNVVRVFDMDYTPAGPFLVMEYVDGSNLHAVVAKSGPLSVDRAVDAVRQAAAGLGHAHAAGLVHRDVKPGNLLLDRMGTVKVVDLGLARYRDASMNAGLTGMYDDNRVIGTADFQAPEQGLDSGSADARSDVYGLGAALFYLLTGRVPYPEGTISNKLLAHQLKPPPNATEVNPAVPRDLSAVIMRLMAKRPADRPQTMTEVRAALAPWQADDLPPPAPEEMPKHPPSAYRLGLCPPLAMAEGGVGHSKSGLVPPLRTGPVSQRMTRPMVGPATGVRGPVSQRMPKPVAPISPPPSNTPRRHDSTPVPVQLAEPDPSGLPRVEPKTSRRGLLIGLGVGAVASAAAGGGLLWYLNNPGTTQSTHPTVPPPTPTTPVTNPTSGNALFTGSGSSFVKTAMDEWRARYEKETGVAVGYNSTGSGLGMDNMLAGNFPFGCTESPITAERAKKHGKDLGEVLHIPLALGALVPAYNIPGLKDRLRFTPAALAGLYAGDITKWHNNPLLLPYNPELKQVDQKVVIVHRSDASGSTFVWMDYLVKASTRFKDAVKDGVAKENIEWVDQKASPNAVGANKNSGVAKAVNDTPFAIGYVEMGYAQDNGIPYGLVKNGDGEWVDASPTTVTAAAAVQIEKLLKEGKDDLVFSLVDAPGKTSYPICSVAWAVLFKHQPGDKGKELVKFLRWVTHDGQKLLPNLRYAALPELLVKKIDEKLDSITH